MSVLCLSASLSVVPEVQAAPRPVLVFVTTYEGTDFDLRIKFSDGTISEPIDPPSFSAPSTGVHIGSSTPSISPDGTKIAFVG